MEEDLNFSNFTVTHDLKRKKRKHKNQKKQKCEDNEGISFATISEDLALEISEGQCVKRKKHRKRQNSHSEELETKEKQKKRKHSAELQRVDNLITNDTDPTFIGKTWETITAENDEAEEWNIEHATEEHRSKKRKKKLKKKRRSSEDQVCEEIMETSYPHSENLNDEEDKEVVPSSAPHSLGKKLQKKRKLEVSMTSGSSGEIAFSDLADISEPLVTEDDCHEAALKEMEEFIPHVRNLCRSTVMSMIKNDLPRFRMFKKLGIPIKHGRFTMEENKRIRKNVEKFLLRTGIDSADKLFNPSRYPEESVKIKQIKLHNDFFLKIAKGIPRTCKLVYMRAAKMFNIYNYKGRYTKEEERTLKEHQATRGNNWKMIGELMLRSSHSIALKYSQMKNASNRGPWSKEETERLLQVLEEMILNKSDSLLPPDMKAESTPEFLYILREKLYKGISWIEVEAKVGTRNWMQCRSKWTDLLTTKMTQGQKVYSGHKALQAKINMIKRDVPPSYVQAKFYKLKARRVPNWNKKTFSEIIDFLYENTLPVFEERLRKMKEKRSLETCSQQKQIAFRFQDIFQYEYIDSENE
ncbi:transcription termination factor 1 isoform X2 [Rhinatrema bivittatum]|uniref:transcription termination factor 1 isoform X2 n=1 Tax=Rhinatrema bivittatum TaxID=194408 RepID=UPI00112CB2CC|nr:transcription termination factor 1 isoform X2 [Rhinatrema bivittatum]